MASLAPHGCGLGSLPEGLNPQQTGRRTNACRFALLALT